MIRCLALSRSTTMWHVIDTPHRGSANVAGVRERRVRQGVE